MFRHVLLGSTLALAAGCGAPVDCEPNTRSCEGTLLVSCDDRGVESVLDCAMFGGVCDVVSFKCVLPQLDAGASMPDAGEVDSGVVDAGEPDAGPEDAGTTMDAGVISCSAPWPTNPTPAAVPPFAGTAYIDTDIISATDPSSFVDLTYTGRGVRTMFDRRTNSYNQVNAHLFDARFGISKHVEIQVNPEFAVATAETHARYYAHAVGQLPAFLFRDLDTMWIHDGNDLFGGSNRNILIHVQQGQYIASRGWLEEVLLHEAAHTNVDAMHAMAPRWVEARTADRGAISDYARDNPVREDVAETVVVWFAAKFRANRMDPVMVNTIEQTVPNRLRYLDCVGFDDSLLP